MQGVRPRTHGGHCFDGGLLPDRRRQAVLARGVFLSALRSTRQTLRFEVSAVAVIGCERDTPLEVARWVTRAGAQGGNTE